MTESRFPLRATSLPMRDRGSRALTEASMSAPSDPRRSVDVDARPEYYYRRRLTVRELLPAVGIGIGAGAVAFYVARVLLERTPLVPATEAAGRRQLARARSAPTHPARDRR